MKKTKAYRTEAASAIHETATGLFEAGIIDKQTMREFDESCLTPIHEFTPAQIRALREREQVSHAHHLNYFEGFDQPVGTRRKTACGAIAQAPLSNRTQRPFLDSLKH